MPSAAASIAWNMIRKSGSWFSEKTCSTKISECQSIQSEATGALIACRRHWAHWSSRASKRFVALINYFFLVIFVVFVELCLFVAKQFLDLPSPWDR